MRVSIIGAGRLGRTIARLMVLSGVADIVDVLSRSCTHSQQACDFIGQGQPGVIGDTLQPADVYLLSVPDDAIAEVAGTLAGQNTLSAGSIVCHASGATGLDVLAPLAACGVKVASVHPAFSFADPERAVQNFAGAYCAIQAAPETVPELTDLVLALGGRPFTLLPEGKPAYHAALTVASNYLVTLSDMAFQLTAAAGIDQPTAVGVLGDIMQKTLANVLAIGPEPALTGPISRGDKATLQSHLHAMPDSLLAQSYSALGLQTVQLASSRLAPAKQQQLVELLATALLENLASSHPSQPQ